MRNLLVVIIVAALALACSTGLAAEKYRSAQDVAWSADGKLLAVSDRTGGAVAILDNAGKLLREAPLNGNPCGVVFGAGNTCYVAEYDAGTVAEVDAATGKVLRRLKAGPKPVELAVAPKSNLLLVGNYGLKCVSIIDLATGNEKARIDLNSHPQGIAVNADETIAMVANLMPFGNANDATTASCVTAIDLKGLKKAADIKLTPGSMDMRGVVFSPDGKWAYAAHALGRFTLPTTQLDRGWVNTNALTIIDVQTNKLYATVLLDRLMEGAADPWGLAIAKDGKCLWITLSGVHQVAKLDLESLHLLMEGKDIPADKPAPNGVPRHLSTVWAEIKKDPTKRTMLANDLAALYGAGLLIRTKIDGSGPRGLALSPDGKKLAVACYFTGSVILIDADSDKALATAALPKQPKMDSVRRGEMIFHDGTQSFQHWLSCATCHPDGARADGLNWDLLNDGIGNPKNTRSLLLANKTPPSMSLAIRSDFAVAAAAGFRFILFREPQPQELDAVKDYLKALTPEKSPYLTPDGKLTTKALRGKAIFESSKAGCTSCHPGPLFTNLKLYDVGTRGELDRKDSSFDTPTLIEIWRTAPYLHDGSAATLREMLIDRNKKDTHGSTSQLKPEEVDALIEYLLSL